MNAETLSLSPAVRSRIYLACLIVNVLAVVVLGILAVWELMDPVKAAATIGCLLAGVGIVSNALALGYRATRGCPHPDCDPSAGTPAFDD